MFILGLLVLCLGYASAAPTSGSCMCVHGSSVRVHSTAGINSHTIGSVNTNQCFIFNGGVLTKDGYTWYELQNVLGHHRAWVASNYLQHSTSSHCSGGSSSGGTSNVGSFATGIVSQHCLQCICQVESGCKPLACAWDVNSNSCGYFQIKKDYWLDCGSPGSSWESCALDLHCASGCVQKYMERYASHYGCPLTCEGFAREHNGGPRGCKHSGTVGYWHHVQAAGCH